MKNKQKVSQLRILLSVLVLSLLFTACRKSSDFDNLDNAQWNPTLAVPLINTDVEVEDFISSDSDQEFIEIGTENEIYMIYKSEVLSLSGSDLFDIPDISGVLNTNNIDLTIPFGSQQKIGKVQLKSGKMNYSISAENTDPAEIEFNMPFAKKSEIPFEETISIGGTESSFKSGSFDLSNYNIDFSGNGTLNNKLNIQTFINLVNGGFGDFDDYNIIVTFQDLIFEYVEGFFGGLNLGLLGDTISLPLFEKWTEGTFQLFDPQISIALENSFGFPINATFTTFEADEDLEGQTVIPLETSVELGDTFQINYPDLFDMGGTESTDFNFNENNSNISNVISISPKQLKYALFFVGNTEVDSSNFNFILDDSFFKVNLDLKLPMRGQIENVVVLDTFDFTASTTQLFQNINTARFRLETINNLPLGLDLQVYFLDEDNQILDSLLNQSETILKAPVVDGQGTIIAPENNVNFIDFDTSSALTIDNAKKIFVRIKMNTSENGSTPVSLFTDYYLGLKLGVITNLKLN